MIRQTRFIALKGILFLGNFVVRRAAELQILFFPKTRIYTIFCNMLDAFLKNFTCGKSSTRID